MANIDKKFIVNLAGKEFVTYEGLLDVAHQMGLKSIKTEIVMLPSKENDYLCVMKAIVTTKDEKEFHGFGDANKMNVNSLIAKHLIRMAETRAKARALRDLTNIGMTAIEELGEESEHEMPKQEKKKEITNVKKETTNVKKESAGINDPGLKCLDCGDELAQGVAVYSKKNFGKELCMGCQNKYK